MLDYITCSFDKDMPVSNTHTLCATSPPTLPPHTNLAQIDHKSSCSMREMQHCYSFYSVCKSVFSKMYSAAAL